MKLLTALPLACLALAACNQKDVSLTNASPEEVAKAQAASGTSATMQMRPGKWETKIEILEVSMPGMPAGAGDSFLAKMKDKPDTITSCLTEEDIRRGNAKLFGSNSSCTFSKYDRSGAKIDAVMKCPGKDGGELVSKISGSSGPDLVEVTGESDLTGKGGEMAMHQKMRMTSRRLGECDGTEKH